MPDHGERDRRRSIPHSARPAARAVRFPRPSRHREAPSRGVNAEVNFPSCAEVEIPTLLDVLGQCETFCLGGRPRRFFGSTGAEMGGSLKFSGTSLACSLSR